MCVSCGLSGLPVSLPNVIGAGCCACRRDGVSQELRLLVPAALCGSIIGKGGATIRSFSEDSKAQIGLSPQVHTS